LAVICVREFSVSARSSSEANGAQANVVAGQKERRKLSNS
jgi:hypothetical protein